MIIARIVMLGVFLLGPAILALWTKTPYSWMPLVVVVGSIAFGVSRPYRRACELGRRRKAIYDTDPEKWERAANELDPIDQECSRQKGEMERVEVRL